MMDYAYRNAYFKGLLVGKRIANPNDPITSDMREYANWHRGVWDAKNAGKDITAQVSIVKSVPEASQPEISQEDLAAQWASEIEEAPVNQDDMAAQWAAEMGIEEDSSVQSSGSKALMDMDLPDIEEDSRGLVAAGDEISKDELKDRLSDLKRAVSS